MDIEREISEAETVAKRELTQVVELREVNEAKVLSPQIVLILVRDISATDNDSVVYKSGSGTYEVSFGFAEVKLPDGKLGMFEEIPDDDLVRKAETLAFTVSGLHPKKEVEMDFRGDSVSVMPGTELRKIYDFQLAVLRSARK